MPEPLMKINRMGALQGCRDCFMSACVVRATVSPTGDWFFLIGTCGQPATRQTAMAIMLRSRSDLTDRTAARQVAPSTIFY
jgi:hypothetical protein